jgi:hypothetical protein
VPFRRTSLATLAACALLTGCTSVVAGTASPADGLRTDVSDSEFPVNLAGDGETDRIARNSLADVLAYWEQTFPEVFGEDFGTVEGGFWSIDPDQTRDADLPDDSGCFNHDVNDLADNAFYCPPDDAVYYDRAWMSDLAEEYGPFVIAEIMAHEMGHAVQGHAGIDEDSIIVETQAECFAGAWTRWVVDGNSQHFTVRAPALDPYLLGYLYFGDPAGSDPTMEGAHGSLFDQLSAFQEGYADGPQACVAFDSTRVYTEEPFDPDEEDTGGDLSFDESVDFVDDTLAAFWQQAFATGFDDTPALGGQFAAPAIRAADGEGMVCGGAGEELDLEFCAEDGSVRYDSGDLLEPAHDDVGDFAVDTLLSLPYGMAVRQQRGLSTDDPEAVTSVVCAAGWYARELYLGAVEGSPVVISPGDVDEAAVVLLTYATQRSVLPDAGLSGFELADYFRQGFVDGGTACGL